MYKTDKRLTQNHLTEEELAIRLKEIDKLTDADDISEKFEIELEPAELLNKINAKNAAAQPVEKVETEELTSQ